MLSLYNKVEISKLLINSEFTFNSQDKIVSLSSSGISISLRDINTFRCISDLEAIDSVRTKNFNLCNTLNINDRDKVRWDLLLGKSLCKEFTKDLISSINFSKEFITTYHTEVLPKRRRLYESLCQIKDKAGNLLETPTYNHSGVSGRTSIKSGFNFLTSSKDFRNSCTSTKLGNVLVSIDFKACEPNLYLRSIGREIDNPDVYSYLMKELSIQVEDRSKLKRGILAVLYGASDDTANRILGGNSKTLASIKEFFMIKETSNVLNNQFQDKQYIFNMYGRPIFSNKSILNKWIQSSAVDFCSLAFLEFVEKHDLKVAYLVHDDMVVDCSKQEYDKIKDIKELIDPVTKISLPVEITVTGS